LPVNCLDVNGNGCNQLTRTADISCAIVLNIPLARNFQENLDSANSLNSDPCLKIKEVGMCKAAIPRFYFDQTTSSCKKFIFGGCRGNENNFATKESCKKQCSQHLAEPLAPSSRSAPVGNTPEENLICEQPMDAGFCYALSQRYFYNTQTKRCDQFLYGGCSGNKNNFKSEEDCISTCHTTTKRRGPPRQLLLPSTEPRCVAGNETFAVGDIVRIDSDPCKACVCSTPPEISCFEKKCPFLAPVNRGNPDCKVVKDDLGCCDERLECPEQQYPVIGPGGVYVPELSVPELPAFPGMGGVPGGFSSEALSPEVKKIAAATAKDHLITVPQVTGVMCEHAQLLEILDASSQVVAGTNYRLSLRLRAKSGPMCSDSMERYCKNIMVHQPLAFNCQNADPLKCLELINVDEIQCFETEEEFRANQNIGEFVPELPFFEPEELPFFDPSGLEPDFPVIGGGGGMGVPGGFSSQQISSELKKIAIVTARNHLKTVPQVSTCEYAQLLEIIDASSQVVAGTNYRLSLRLRTKSGPGCSDVTETYCKNIMVHQPLAFRCQDPDPLKCLELMREDEIQCFETREELLAK
jgi:hypothetical protein